ncbi:hypothetical protein C8Q73DRAFT_814212 [Cubamyces lactineus]|nr:hypothetical protein C8Q73DRAFT_814212 [Cubamyces lactineus]
MKAVEGRLHVVHGETDVGALDVEYATARRTDSGDVLVERETVWHGDELWGFLSPLNIHAKGGCRWRAYSNNLQEDERDEEKKSSRHRTATQSGKPQIREPKNHGSGAETHTGMTSVPEPVGGAAVDSTDGSTSARPRGGGRRRIAELKPQHGNILHITAIHMSDEPSARARIAIASHRLHHDEVAERARRGISRAEQSKEESCRMPRLNQGIGSLSRRAMSMAGRRKWRGWARASRLATRYNSEKPVRRQSRFTGEEYGHADRTQICQMV